MIMEDMTEDQTWDCGLLAYATVRDSTCWQLNRSEIEIWTLLEGFESSIEDFNPLERGVETRTDLVS